MLMFPDRLLAGWWSAGTARGSSRSASHSRVPSLLPLSATMSSWLAPRCAWTLAIASCRNARRSRVVITTVTLGSIARDAKPGRAVRVGIVCGEFLQPGATRIGGFGWAAARAAEELRRAGDDPVFICPDVEALRDHPPAFGATPLIAKRDGVVPFVRELRRAKPDVLLSIDYRPSYDTAFKALPRTPMIVWVRDPRPPEDVAAEGRIRIPGRPGDELPQGLDPIDCTPLRRIARWSRALRRPIAFASPAPDALTPKAPGTYGVDPGRLALLPKPIGVGREPGPKARAPRVAFLGRLYPYKGPWLFVDLARAFPDVDFTMLGQSHFEGPGSWEPADPPANLRLAGNLAGDEKLRELDAAWVLVNTSPHEALAVSLQEALASRTPLLACVDTEGVVSRFGVSVGRFAGDGLDALPALRDGLARLLGDDELRARLGAEGREWVCGRHTPERCVAALLSLAEGAGGASRPSRSSFRRGPAQGSGPAASTRSRQRRAPRGAS